MAAATLTSGIENADGRLFLHLEKAPWCDGGVFSLNPDPDIPTTPEHPFNKAMVMRQAIEAAFKQNEPKQALPVAQPSTLNPQPSPGPGLDGVYLDSLEMSSGELNYRREHFRTASVPLVFDHEGRPCQLMIFNTWTFERDIAAQMHARGQAPVRECRALAVLLPCPAARCAWHRSQLAAARRIRARLRRGHELPPRPVPPKALLPADEHRLSPSSRRSWWSAISSAASSMASGPASSTRKPLQRTRIGPQRRSGMSATARSSRNTSRCCGASPQPAGSP